MDLATAGAVACPVCTLYLREGISLQRHLDTHPKEQVIEALIRASSSGQGQSAAAAAAVAAAALQAPVVPAPVSPGVPTPTTAPAPAPAQAQPQYPMGLFECPPIMQPQFASFSYQQFVNNGTMMIPQYAMAPQNNQMMQMFYNPYGMYQHQQVPTVQMISPITPMPATTSMTTMSTMTARFRATSSTIEVPRSIAAPSIESSREPEQAEESALAESTSPARPVANEEPELEEEQRSHEKSGSDERLKDADGLYIVTNGQAEGESILPEITDEEIARSTGFKEPRYFYSNDCNNEKSGEEVQQQIEETVVRIEDEAELTVGVSEEVKDAREKEDETMEAVVLEKEVETSKTIEEEEEEQIGTVEPREEQEEQNEDEVIEMEPVKESEEPSSSVYKEDEQLERLLSNIIENELQQRHKASEEHEDVENDHEASDVIANDLEEMALSTNDLSHSDDAESPYFQIYNYRKSQSVPSSPIALKKFHRTISRVSLCSDLDSVDNLCVYPEDLEGNALQECVGEERFDDLKNNMDVSDEFRDHYDEAENDAELGQQPEHEEAVQSTVLESSKPSSPVSVRSFCNVEIDNSSRDVDEFVQADLSADNVPIDCTKPDKEKADFQKSTESINEGYVEDKVINEDEAENSFAGSYPVMETESPAVSTSYPLNELDNSHNLMNLSESVEPLTSSDSSKSFHCKSQLQKPSAELLNISEDAHVGPVNVFEFDGLQILVPSTFISDSSQKAVSGTSQQSMASSEGGTNIDEEIKSVNMRADESMPSRGELSEQESNGCTEQSAWQLYMGQESSRVSTSYDLMARESWEESEGSDNEAGVPLLDSRSLATHFASSLFLDRDRKTPTRRTFKCSHCSEVFECPKERRVHITTAHKEASSSGRSGSSSEQHELKDIKILDGRTNVFEDIFTPGLHVQQAYHQQPLLHQLQPPQRYNAPKSETDQKIDGMGSATEVSCSVCNQRFVSEKSLQMHRRRMHETAGVKRIREVSKCQICQEEFPSVVLFNSHLKIHPLECGQCGKYFYRKQNFKLHMKRHLGIKPFACTTCDKAFLTKQKLDEHMNGHTGNAPVKCNLCNETFRRYSNLTQHKNRHHLNIKKKLKDYICHCGEVFHTKKKLAWHKETHDEKPKACTYCNERFVHMASLTRHMRRAHNRRFVPDAQREVENVECPICKCIYLRSSLAVHMRVHNGERPYECQVCSKAFSTKWNLQLHKWTHAARSAKPFKCNQCSAAFYRHSDYTAHMNSHRNVRPYTCNYCGAQFIRKYNCLRHVKEHEENKAHTCEICKKTFHRSYYLKEHLRVHSGARPYSCHICGKSSSTKSNHNKHVRIHHAREPVNTEN